MHTLLRAGAAVAAAALLVGLNATASTAVAKTTWSVSPGGAIAGTSTNFVLLDMTSDGPLVGCASTDLKGTLKSGHGLKGAGLLTVTSVKFHDCQINNQPLSVSTGTWSLRAVFYRSGVTYGTLSGIHIVVSNGTCSFVVDGTSAKARDGTVKIAYTNSTDELEIRPYRSNLHLYGCPGHALSTNPVSIMNTTYPIAPGQTITSP
jgi:hypothetical protein